MAKTKDAAPDAAEQTKDAAPALRLVKMTRPAPVHPGGPITADVHPAEVADWAAHGWSAEKGETK